MSSRFSQLLYKYLFYIFIVFAVNRLDPEVGEMEAGNITLGDFPATKHTTEFDTQTMSIFELSLYITLVVFLENVTIVFLKCPACHW